jgi:alanyl-tRNA synthetase
MTDRLYYTDSYLREFSAKVAGTSDDGLVVYLDRTAFYPTSGGQPYDAGSLSGIGVVDVVDEGERIAHKLAAPFSGAVAQGAVDWTRRFDHMQQHTGQHLLSAVFEERFHLKTVSFHLGADSATIDIEGGSVDARVLEETERRANEVIWENRPVTVEFVDAADATGLRKATERSGEVRIISIAGLDRSACGGTHLRATGEIGAILLRKTEKIRQATRVEFLCGGRAVRRAHADYVALAKAAQLFSVAGDEAPAAIAALQEASRAAEKSRKKLELDLAAYQGRELYEKTAADGAGLRRATQRSERGNLDELRALAQSFTAGPKAVFLAAIENPPSVLLAVSEDSGIDAGKALKSAIAEAGGRGGGTARIAQGSVADAKLLSETLSKLEGAS